VVFGFFEVLKIEEDSEVKLELVFLVVEIWNKNNLID